MKDYRTMAVEVTKIAGEELINRAEELIPNTEGVKEIDIWIRIPSLSDDSLNIPSIEVSTEVYPKQMAIQKIVEVLTKG